MSLPTALPSTPRTALIFGITGQDGSYLAELLLLKGYRVFGVARPRAQGVDISNLPGGVREAVPIILADITDPSAVLTAVQAANPDEVYNLAAMSFVPSSWVSVGLTMDTNATGAVNVFNAVHQAAAKARVYQASTSEMFGNVEPPQNEMSPMHPISPYGVAKLAAHKMGHVYRLSYGMFVCCGICFNHESPRRGSQFVSRKIAKSVAEIWHGSRTSLPLGDMSACRDWGWAPDYVEAMWRMLQQDTPEDFVIATGRSHSVRDFVREAFMAADLDDWEKYIVSEQALVRPTEIHRLVGNADKAKRVLGWTPTIEFGAMVRNMVNHEIDLLNL